MGYDFSFVFVFLTSFFLCFFAIPNLSTWCLADSKVIIVAALNCKALDLDAGQDNDGTWSIVDVFVCAAAGRRALAGCVW
jgi:hypothetical protein